MSSFAELKRRNVFRAGAAYLVIAWLIVQVADILLQTFAAPDWVMLTLFVALALGLPITLAVSWAYEITIQGVKRTEDVRPQESITDLTGRKLDFVIIGVLAVAVALFSIDRFLWRQFGSASEDLVGGFSMAILPFEFSSDQIAPFFGELSGELKRTLSRVEEIRLASPDAIDAVPKESDNADIATRLGVRYVVSGALDLNDRELEPALSLFDSKGEPPMRTQVFRHAQLPDASQRISSWLTSQIGAVQANPVIGPVDEQAFDLYLQARQHHMSEFLSDDAEQLYREAIELQPKFAASHAGLCRLFVTRFEWPSRRCLSCCSSSFLFGVTMSQKSLLFKPRYLSDYC